MKELNKSISISISISIGGARLINRRCKNGDEGAIAIGVM